MTTKIIHRRKRKLAITSMVKHFKVTEVYSKIFAPNSVTPIIQMNACQFRMMHDAITFDNHTMRPSRLGCARKQEIHRFSNSNNNNNNNNSVCFRNLRHPGLLHQSQPQQHLIKFESLLPWKLHEQNQIYEKH